MPIWTIRVAAVFAGLLFVGGTVPAAWCPTLAMAEERPKVALLQGFPSMSFAPIYVARAKGFFEAEGLDMDVQIVRGASVAYQGVVAGQAPFAAMGITELVTAAGKGLRNTIAIAAVNRRIFTGLAVRKDVAEARKLSRDMAVRDRIAALRGLRIASASPGGAVHTVLLYLLKQAGLDPTRDVTIVAMGGQTEMLAAMRAKHVDAFIVGPPGGEVADSEGLAVLVLALSRGEMPELSNIIYDGLVTTRPFAEKHPDVVRKVVRAIGRAANFIPQHPDETRDIMLKFFDKTPPQVMHAVIANVRDAYPEDARITDEMWANTMRFNVQAGKIATPLESREGVYWTNAYNAAR